MPAVMRRIWAQTVPDANSKARLRFVLDAMPLVQSASVRLTEREFAPKGMVLTVPRLDYVETRRVLPMLCLWQGAGAAVETLLSGKGADKDTTVALVDFARVFHSLLPEADPKGWQAYEGFVVPTKTGDEVVLKNWAVGGAVPRDPLKNPVASPESWQFVNEPLFIAVCDLMQEVVPLSMRLAEMPALRGREELCGHLANLRDAKRRVFVRAVLLAEPRGGAEFEGAGWDVGRGAPPCPGNSEPL